MENEVRYIGILAYFVALILFLISVGTVGWMNVSYHEGEAGLWAYCNFHMNTSNSTSNAEQDTSTSTADRDPDAESKEDNEDECTSFGVVHIDSYLHIVRLMAIAALFCFAWAVCKGNTLTIKVEYHPSFIRRHLGELVSLMGVLLGIFSVEVYKANFKTDGTLLPYLVDLVGEKGERGGELLHLDWSTEMLHASCGLMLGGLLLMLTPSIREKLGLDDACPCSCQGLSAKFAALRRDFRSQPAESFYRFITCRSVPENRSTSAPPRPAQDVELGGLRDMLDAASSSRASSHRRRASDSSVDSVISGIFVITDRSRQRSRMAGPDGHVDNSEPAPRYEDLAPLPPDTTPTQPMVAPPSYDDVLKGLYVIPNGTDSPLPPPPAYSPPEENPIPSAPTLSSSLHPPSAPPLAPAEDSASYTSSTESNGQVDGRASSTASNDLQDDHIDLGYNARASFSSQSSVPNSEMDSTV